MTTQAPQSEATGPPSLGDRMVANLAELRVLLKEYRLLPEDDQKAARHALYQKHGQFGKLFKEALFDKFATFEKDFETKEATKRMASV